MPGTLFYEEGNERAFSFFKSSHAHPRPQLDSWYEREGRWGTEKARSWWKLPQREEEDLLEVWRVHRWSSPQQLTHLLLGGGGWLNVTDESTFS